MVPEKPAVLVLLVVTDGAEWLPDVLRGLRSQKHRPIELLAIDNASTDASPQILEETVGEQRIVRLKRRVGYGLALAAGLKMASEREIPADCVLLLHDDAELAPGAVEAMTECMRATGAGIVGAKLVEWSDPTLLQDIGQTTDRYGRAIARVERGELDQGQHDGVHPVLYATSAVMLIDADVIERVGMFDPRYVVMRDDLDFCWRARLAGYETVVTTDAVARHVAATARATRKVAASKRTRYYSDRNMIATLIKNYGALRLALTVPITVVISIVNAVLFLGTGRRRASVQVLEAIRWNIAHLPSTMRARYRAQRTRTRGDDAVTDLMHHGATRMRAQFERAVELVVGDIDEGDESAGRTPTILERLRRHPTATTVAIAAIVGAIGARTLFFAGPMTGLDMAAFPSAPGNFFSSFFSGWRGPGGGGAGPATPGLAILGVISVLCLGSTWLAQRLLVLGLPVVGGIAMWRAARALGVGPAGRRLAAILYLVSPLVLGAFGAGRFADLVLFAAAPWLVVALLRTSGVLPGASPAQVLRVGLVLAVVAALSPWALVLFFGGALVLSVLGIGEAPRATVALRAATALGVALAVLFPWSVELFREGSPLGAGSPDAKPGMLALLGLTPGSVEPIPSALRYGAALAALAGIAVGAERARIRSALGALAFAGLIGAWAVARGVPWIAPRPSVVLATTAVAFAALAGFAFDWIGPALSARQVGVAHLATGVIGALVVAQIAVGALWVARGERPGLGPATLAPSFFSADAAQRGAFRVAWFSGDAEHPVVALTDADGATMRTYLSRPAGAGADALRAAVAAISSGTTTAGARMLATLGVRFVVARPDAEASLVERLGAQVDLQLNQRFRGATIYENMAQLPIAAGIASSGWRAASNGVLASVTGVEPAPGAGPGFVRTAPARYAGRTPAAATTVLLAENFTTRWRARAGGRTLQPLPSFGWATRFDAPANARVEIEWRGQRWHRAALLLQLVIVLLLVGEWSRRAARERGER